MTLIDIHTAAWSIIDDNKERITPIAIALFSVYLWEWNEKGCNNWFYCPDRYVAPIIGCANHKLVMRAKELLANIGIITFRKSKTRSDCNVLSFNTLHIERRIRSSTNSATDSTKH